MSMHHPDSGALQDLREGLLTPGEEEEVRTHLAGCSVCREEYEGLSQLVSGLAQLPREAEPARDLWPQIAWRIEAAGTGREGAEATVAGRADLVDPGAGRATRDGTPGPGAERPGKGAVRRFTLSAGQLVAASIAVALISGSAVWALLSRAPGPTPAGGPPASGVVLTAGWLDAFDGYDQALSDLQTVLEEGRSVLDPETVRVLEENLATIDSAIEQSREALNRDPGSFVLQRLLSDNLRKKVDLLRHAALAVLANT
jgi:hypothetical protein